MQRLNRFRRARRDKNSTKPKNLRDRGAALLEFALIAPLFFLVVFGGIEIGYMFRSNLALEDAARSASRVASVQRSSADADLAIIEHIHDRSASLNGDIARIVIFQPATLNAEVPAGCSGPAAASSQSDDCNVYDVTNGDVQMLIDGWGPMSTETGFPLNERLGTGQTNIGVHIEYEYQYVTGFFDTLTLSSTSVEVIELDL